jgi:hypothetical protein
MGRFIAEWNAPLFREPAIRALHVEGSLCKDGKKPSTSK